MEMLKKYHDIFVDLYEKMASYVKKGDLSSACIVSENIKEKHNELHDKGSAFNSLYDSYVEDVVRNNNPCVNISRTYFENHSSEIFKALTMAEIKEFTLSASATNLLDNVAMYEREGYVLDGFRYVNKGVDYEGVEEKIPALHFTHK